MLGLFGSGAILATLILLLIALAGGYLLGGPGQDTRRVLALGTGQRNMAAGFAIATSNFADQPDVLVFLAAAGLVGMVVVMPVAAEFGKRAHGRRRLTRPHRRPRSPSPPRAHERHSTAPTAPATGRRVQLFRGLRGVPAAACPRRSWPE